MSLAKYLQFCRLDPEAARVVTLENMSTEKVYTFPTIENLPRVGHYPQGCLWGFYDNNGEKDEIGGMSRN